MLAGLSSERGYLDRLCLCVCLWKALAGRRDEETEVYPYLFLSVF